LIAAVAEERMWLSTMPPVDVDARAARLRDRLAAAKIVSFVAERDAVVVGELSFFVGPAGVMIGMCLARDVRGRGIGGALLDEAIAYASLAGWPLLLLDVYAHNVAARRLYESRGFVAVAAVETRLGDGRVFETITMERLAAGPVRRAVLGHVADAIIARGDVRFVAVDGTDGAGKTCFATELAHELRRRERPVIRASVDGFHHPRAVRYRRGRSSPLGFYEDSYDYAALERALLAPLRRGGNGWYRLAVHDVDIDAVIERDEEEAPPDAILVLDGIFLHRDELRDAWDYSIFLDVPFDVSIPRGAARDAGDSARDAGDADPTSAANHRYVEGQRIYVARAQPHTRASIVIDNTDLTNPRILRG
jgi:uridine kinase